MKFRECFKQIMVDFGTMAITRYLQSQNVAEMQMLFIGQ